MTATLSILAFDLGAESGRAVLGHFDGERLRLEEVLRFGNGPVPLLGSLHWDVLRLWAEVTAGLRAAAARAGHALSSAGVDTWGVDLALLASDGSLLGNPYHYRDRRTDGIMEEAFRVVPRAEIYAQTGIQFLQFNTLYQLLAMVKAGSPALAAAQTLLTIPDLFHYWLSGCQANEFTIATTTQCYDPRRGGWATDLLQRLSIPTHIFGRIVPPCTVLGPLQAEVAREADCPVVPVVAPGSHDTASAVAAVPVTRPDYAYLSSGTWSLMGVEVQQPVIGDQSLACNVTNEGGVGGTFRLLKNIMGLWLVQECRRAWARTGDALSYDDLTALAAEAPAFGSFVVPGDARFLPPGDMPARIQAFCRETGQAVPESRGQIVRCALESLALEYRRVLAQLEGLAGHPLPVLHVVGGGSRNRLLNQFTANATGRAVIAGPVEATATGNILGQALALGHIGSLAEGRTLVRRSFDVVTFEPEHPAAWDDAYARYLQLVERTQTG
jgi:rhamnulokinase